MLLRQVARQLGPELLRECAFVGGATVHLYLDDPGAAIRLRATEDVDIIVEVHPSSIIGYQNFAGRLKERGFREQEQDGPMCRFRTDNGLILDVMPTDEKVLRFGNRWYKDEYSKAGRRDLGEGIHINLIRLEHFFATKFSSWSNRGKSDLMHRDAEDILTVIDGVNDIEQQLQSWPVNIKTLVRSGMIEFRELDAFDHFLAGNLSIYGDPSRVVAISARWDNMILRLGLS